jgi:hypothetical protein
MSILLDQTDFMAAAGQKIAADVGQTKLYAELVREECAEFAETQQLGYVGKPTDEIKEICDVLVVSAGFLISRLGHTAAQLAWTAVWESNMAKTKGKLEKREDGKLLQNADYKAVAKAEMLAKLESLL